MYPRASLRSGGYRETKEGSVGRERHCQIAANALGCRSTSSPSSHLRPAGERLDYARYCQFSGQADPFMGLLSHRFPYRSGGNRKTGPPPCLLPPHRYTPSIAFHGSSLA
jgi:hypothetical protein